MVGLRSYRYVDSIDYETLDFTGGSRRPWVTPLLYWLVGDDPTRIFAQAVLGALCWSLLAAEVALHVEHRWTRRAAVGAVALLGASTAITNWDTTILSESLAISATALAAAAYLRFGRVRSLSAALGAVGATLLWVFTRQNHLVLLGLVVGAVLVVVAVARWRTHRWDRPLLVLGGGLVLVAVLAGAVLRAEHRDPRVQPGDGHRPAGHHRPRRASPGSRTPACPCPTRPCPASSSSPSRSSRTTTSVPGSRRTATAPTPASSSPTRGSRSPSRSTTSWPTRSRGSTQPRGDDVMLATPDPYGSTRQLVPEQLELLVFDAGNSGTIVVALAAVLAATFHRWRRTGWDRRWLVPLAMIGLQWPALTVVWHASTAELGRLALVSALLLRIGMIVQAALVADGWFGDRHVGA